MRIDCLCVSSKILSCGADGIHLDEKGHISLAEQLAEIIINFKNRKKS